MKGENLVWLKCESKGHPNSTIVEKGTVIESVKTILSWLLKVTLGHKIVITIGRHESDVNPKSTDELVDATFASIMAQIADDSEDELSALGISQTITCVHENTRVAGAFEICTDCGASFKLS